MENKNAFTLIELLVSMSIITVVILAAMGIYINVIGTRQKTLGQLNLQEDGQYIMSLIVKDIRAGQVDYDNYPTAACPAINPTTKKTERLCLLDFASSPNQIRYMKETIGDRNVFKRCKGNPCGTYYTITMTDISIERLDFYIDPASDPFTTGSTTYEHPRVTIVLKLKSLIEKTGEKELILQQTVPQRYEYKK